MKFLLHLLAMASAALILGSAGMAPASAQPGAKGPVTVELYIDEVYEQLTGGDVVYSIAFRDPLTRSLNPSIHVHEGDSVAIKVVNRTARPRTFAIMSVPGAKTASIRAGGSTVLRFTAPARGNYIYNDPTQATAAETRTLFGDFVVSPKAG